MGPERHPTLETWKNRFLVMPSHAKKRGCTWKGFLGKEGVLAFLRQGWEAEIICRMNQWVDHIRALDPLLTRRSNIGDVSSQTRLIWNPWEAEGVKVTRRG